jgi:hypothetical protein
MSRALQGLRLRSLVVATVAAVAGMFGGSSGAHAGYVVSGGSSGVAISSNLSILSLVNADLSVNYLAGTAPTPYSTSLSTTANTNISSGGFLTGTLLSGSTGILTSTVSSTINGVSTSGSANGTTLINNLNLNVLSTLVSIGASTLSTSSTSSGSYGSLSSSGSSTISNLAVSVLGIDITNQLKASDGTFVNVSALGGTLATLGGLEIGIDMKSVTGDGLVSSAITTDNIVVQFNSVSALSFTINGTLDIGQSQASILASPASAVPEPSSLVMTALGLISGGAFGLRARRTKQRVPQV